MESCETIIVNFNGGAFLKATVASALASPAVLRVIVVDNASTDDSLDLLSSESFNRVTVIRNSENLGFAAACNVGLKEINAPYALILNPDCCLAETAVKLLIDAIASNERVGMAGPLLLNPDGSEQAGGRRGIPTPGRSIAQGFGLNRLRWFSADRLPDFLMHRAPLPSHATDVEAISGACMMVRRTAITEVGPLDENYFLHCEDLDWCMRFHERGWRILFVPEARVTHYKGVSSKGRPFAVEWHKHCGMTRFYRKFLARKYPFWLTILVICGIWIRFLAVSGYKLALGLFS